MNTVTVESLDFTSSFIITPSRTGRIHALCGWFDIDFKTNGFQGHNVSFSTSPSATPTHWKQTLFALENPIDLKFNEGSMESEIRVCKRRDNGRELDVGFKITRGDSVEDLTYTVR